MAAIGQVDIQLLLVETAGARWEYHVPSLTTVGSTIYQSVEPCRIGKPIAKTDVQRRLKSISDGGSHIRRRRST